MVGMLVKAEKQKPAEPPVPAPPTVVETPAPEVHKPQPPKPKQKPQIETVRAKPVEIKKSLPRKKSSKKVNPKSTIRPSPSTTSVATTEPVTSTTLSPVVDSEPLNTVSPPQFHAEYLDNPRPRYPLMSRKRREEGEVQLRVNVDAQGHPKSVEIKTSSGHPRLDQAARSAVNKWLFIPARKGGMNVAAWVVVPIQFNLER
jgi:protein TonB